MKLKYAVAALLLAGLALVEGMGWRTHTAAISGSMAPTPEGLLYLGFWFSGLLVAPPLIIAGLVETGAKRATGETAG